MCASPCSYLYFVFDSRVHWQSDSQSCFEENLLSSENRSDNLHVHLFVCAFVMWCDNIHYTIR